MTATAIAPTATTFADGSTVTVYSKPACVQCNGTYRSLDKKGIEYAVVNVAEDAEALELVRSMDYMVAPVVVVRDADGVILNHWGGFRPDKIDELAAAAQAA